MYRVLIVDDEPWVAYGISKLIQWGELGFTVMEQTHDGLTAISMIEQFQPEVVISDIRMPGLDGIELLREIRERELDTAVIFVSGYSEFEYAQQAVKLGAFDYLLKQIDRGALTETVARLKEKLDAKQRNNVDPDILLNDLFDLVDSENQTTIDHFLLGKGYRLLNPHYRFISCLFPYATISSIDQPGVEQEGIQSLSFRTGYNQKTILVNYDERDAFFTIEDFIKLHLQDSVHIGISSSVVCSAPLLKLYQEANIALSSALCGEDLRCIEYREPQNPSPLSAELLQLELVIKENLTAGIKNQIQLISDWCIRQNLLIDQVTDIYNQIVSLIRKYFRWSNVDQNIEFLAYDQVTRLYKSYHALFQGLQDAFSSQADVQILISDDQMKDIMTYIDTHYTEDLILGDVAKHFSMSIGYLSSLIKKKTGTSYSEYIIRKRLQLAKELLTDQTLSVQEVVQRVGYKDYFHFNKWFKRHVGVTPSKFRKI